MTRLLNKYSSQITFENAIVIISVLGESTNAMLHLNAMTRSVNVPLSLDDFQVISNKTSLLADFEPSGIYVMEDLHGVGGLPAVCKMQANSALTQ